VSLFTNRAGRKKPPQWRLPKLLPASAKTGQSGLVQIGSGWVSSTQITRLDQRFGTQHFVQGLGVHQATLENHVTNIGTCLEGFGGNRGSGFVTDERIQGSHQGNGTLDIAFQAFTVGSDTYHAELGQRVASIAQQSHATQQGV